MQIMDTSQNLVFLYEYNEKTNKTTRKEAKSGQKSRVATLAKECCNIISKSRHWEKNVATSVEECHDIISESRHQAKRVTTSTE